MSIMGSDRTRRTSFGHIFAAIMLSLFLLFASLPLVVGVAAASGPTTWRQLSPATSPSARFGTSMAFDGATDQMILFGGLSGTNTYQGDTWAWDGSTWTEVSTTGPAPRYAPSMAYDPSTDQLLLFGGYDGSAFGDTWVWDGTNWSQLFPSTSPSARYGAVMAFDPASSQLLLFGGGYNGTYTSETWMWDGTNWSELSPATSPLARFAPSMAFDEASNQMILFGGVNGGTPIGDTWAWDGSNWTEVSTTGPTDRDLASLAYDPATEQLILFGGFDGSRWNDTWVWDGTSWSRLFLTPSPLGRYAASMAYDPATGQLLLFGGTGSFSDFADTWVYGPVDTTPPTTVASANPSSYTFGDWTNQPVTVTLTPSDEGGSGVASTSYTIDGGDALSYSTPFTITTEGDHTISFGSTDDVGNVELTQTVHVMIDTANPVVTYAGNQGQYTIDQTVNITCSASDALSGIFVTNCQNITGSAASFALGTNSFSANATDKAGNVGSGSVSFTVGVTPDSLCHLTEQIVANARTSKQLCATLALLRVSAATHNTRLKASLVNAYIMEVNLQRGISAHDKAMLIQFARAL